MALCKNLERSVMAIGLGAAAFLGSPEARAEDFAQVLYEDMKSVIQDLMVDEVARTTIPNASCQAPVLLRYYPSSMQRLFDRQLGSLKAGLRTESATLLGSYVYYVLANPGGDLPAFLKVESPPLPPPLGECPAKVTAANGPKYFAKANLGAPQPMLDANCGASYLSPASGSEAAAFARTTACEFALAARDFLLDDKGSAEAHLRRLIAYLLGTQFDPSSRLTTSAQVEELSMVLAAYVKDPNLPAPPAVTDATLTALLGAAAPGLLDAVKATARQWRLLTSDGVERLSPEDVAESLLTIVLPRLSAACQADNTCKEVLKLASAAATRELVDALHRQDVREIAIEGLRSALSVLKSASDCHADQYGFFAESTNASTSEKLFNQYAAVAPTCTQQVTVTRYGRFIATLASYVMEEQEGGTTSDSTRAAFRTAAFDLLRTDGPKTGFDRSFAYGFILPQPALRASYSPGYINEATDNGFRYVATLDWLTFRKQIRYSQSVYAAASLSLVDLLAPFAEAALRKQAPSPDNSMRLWLTAVNPRAELALGFPGLSKHLALVGGFSYRGAAAFRDPNSQDKFTYYTWLGSDARPTDFQNKPGAFYTQFIEISLGIRYIP
jgi:hypothetical protein